MTIAQASRLVLDPSAVVLPEALALATDLNHPVYDCLYLVLARR